MVKKHSRTLCWFAFPRGLAIGDQSLTPTLDYLEVLVQDFTVVAAFREPAVWNDLCFQPLDDATPELIAIRLIANDCRKGGRSTDGEDPSAPSTHM